MSEPVLHKAESRADETPLMPVLFIGHGSPMNAIEDNEFVEGWKGAINSVRKPKAILCISAHWETKGTFVTAMDDPKTIHDFGGFPQKLFDVQYPAHGSPELAGETRSIMTKSKVGLDLDWGLDHGCWSVVRRMYPLADIPVVQLSLDYSRPAAYHFDLAGQLTQLRRKGILIIGSGNMVHNLRLVNWRRMNDQEYGYDWALEANEKMKRFIIEEDFNSLINYNSQGKAFDLAIPSPEHFLPLLYVLALKEKSEKCEIFNDKAVMGSLTMTSVKIGN
jgi:4,5-DOPA dioxygenase extradiol